MNVIYKRRSIRKFKKDEVNLDDVKKVIKAGMNAPSARNLKPGEFIVVTDRNLLDRLSEVKPGAALLTDAPCSIVVCGTETTPMWQHDLGAATQNMLLEAENINLGACWIGVIPDKQEDGFRQILNIPSDIRVFSIIALGCPDEVKEENDNYDESKIHYEKW